MQAKPEREGATMRKYANLGIAGLLVLGGVIVATEWGSAEAGASLAGALFGAAAIFIGSEVTKHDQRIKAESDLTEQRARIRTALMGELVGLTVNHMQSTKLFRSAAESIAGGQEIGSLDFDFYMPPEAPVYQALLSQITVLTEKEIDTLATFHSGLAVTRRSIRDVIRTGNFGLLAAQRIAGHFEHDCSIAAQVVSLLAPNRKIQMPGADPILLTAALKEAAREDD